MAKYDYQFNEFKDKFKLMKELLDGDVAVFKKSNESNIVYTI